MREMKRRTWRRLGERGVKWEAAGITKDRTGQSSVMKRNGGGREGEEGTWEVVEFRFPLLLAGQARSEMERGSTLNLATHHDIYSHLNSSHLIQ